MPLAETILSDPTAVSLLATILTAVVWYVRGIGPRQAVVLDRGRRALWRVLDPLASRLGRPLLRDKTDADAEFIASVEADRRVLLRTLWRHGFRWNPTSTVKYRDLADGRRQFALSVVNRDGVNAGYQQDVHIFPAGEGWAVYGHWEPSVTDPTEHVGGGAQRPGDPEGVVRDALVGGEVER